jgi:hypothetical protein
MDGELVPRDVKEADLRDEVNLRTCRAGYTTRDGGPIPRRPTAAVNWGRQKLNVWPRDGRGNLIE